MKPLETLKHEHRVIEKVLGALERAATELESKRDSRDTVPEQFFEKAVDFLRTFADRCHHSKEEKLLFVKMEEHGVPVKAGPIGIMLSEHEQGRSLIRSLAQTSRCLEDPESRRETARTARAYTSLLRAHIQKEDGVLYPMAEQVLSERELEDLELAFERVESQDMGEGVHEKYHQLAHELADSRLG